MVLSAVTFQFFALCSNRSECWKLLNAMAQIALVTGIRCSFSPCNVVRASANVLLLTILENTKQQHML